MGGSDYFELRIGFAELAYGSVANCGFGFASAGADLASPSSRLLARICNPCPILHSLARI